jgi:hypothetical protein
MHMLVIYNATTKYSVQPSRYMYYLLHALLINISQYLTKKMHSVLPLIFILLYFIDIPACFIPQVIIIRQLIKLL